MDAHRFKKTTLSSSSRWAWTRATKSGTERKGPLEAHLKEDIKQEIGSLYAQTQVLLQSAKDEQAKSKEHNDSMTGCVHLKHEEITAISDEVAKHQVDLGRKLPDLVQDFMYI